MRLFGARAHIAAASAGRRARNEKGLPPPRFPRTALRAPPARSGRQREGGSSEEAGGAEAPERRAAAGPPAGGCGAPGAWKQLCRVTCREDCRARCRGFRAASERARAPRTALAPLRRPPAGPRRRRPSRRRHWRLILRVRARRSGASAGPRRSASRSGAPGSAPGAPAPSLPSRPSCVHRPFRHLPHPAAKPPLPPLSLHPSGGCGAPTRRGWREGCRCRGAPRRSGGSDPPAPA